MLAVCGGKGGVGRTTTAVGLGAALAGHHRATLVVDADADMPDLHALAGTPAEPG
ncbi:MAG: AAA family ATPase, partial [Halobacteriaceae archaeon]